MDDVCFSIPKSNQHYPYWVAITLISWSGFTTMSGPDVFRFGEILTEKKLGFISIIKGQVFHGCIEKDGAGGVIIKLHKSCPSDAKNSFLKIWNDKTALKEAQSLNPRPGAPGYLGAGPTSKG